MELIDKEKENIMKYILNFHNAKTSTTKRALRVKQFNNLVRKFFNFIRRKENQNLKLYREFLE